MFGPLDFVYLPSHDAAADLRYYVDTLGANHVFAVEGMGTRVAMVRLTDAGPALLLAEHLEDDRPILVYRVVDLEVAIAELTARGWQTGHRLEIPFGPVCSFSTRSVAPLSAFQTRAVPSAEAVARRRPSGLKHTLVTGPECSRSARSIEPLCASKIRVVWS